MVVKSLIQLIYEFGVEKVEKNAETNHMELSMLTQIESCLSRFQWTQQPSEDVRAQIQQYIAFFNERRRNYPLELVDSGAIGLDI